MSERRDATELKDGTVVDLGDVDRLSRRRMCAVAAQGLVALALPACVGDVERPFVIGNRGGGGAAPEPVPPEGPTGTGGASGSGAIGTGGTGTDPGDPGTAPPPDAGSGGRGGTGGRGRRGMDAGMGTGGSNGGGGGTGGGTGGTGGLPPPPDAGASRPAASCGNGGFSTGRAASAFAMGTGTYFSAVRAFVCRDGGGLYALSASCTHAGVTINFSNNSGGFHCPAHGSNFDLQGGVTRGPANNPLRHFLVCVGPDGTVQIDVRTTVGSSARVTG
jgi:Rieske Fe-S protein